MRRFILIVACLAGIALSTHTYAQSLKPRFGIKAGVNMMTLGTTAGSGVNADYNLRLGLQGGVYAHIPFGRVVSFEPNILYVQKGGTVNTTTAIGVKIDGSTRINYIDVPLLFNFRVGPDVSLSLGPQVSFLASQKTEVTVNNASASSTSTNGARKTIMGGNAGVAYHFNNDLSLNLNYVVDFQYMLDENVASTDERSRGFALTLGYKF